MYIVHFSFNTSMLLLIVLLLLYNGLKEFQYIHVTINQGLETGTYINIGKFQYIHVTINQSLQRSICEKGLVSIHPCYY